MNVFVPVLRTPRVQTRPSFPELSKTGNFLYTREIFDYYYKALWPSDHRMRGKGALHCYTVERYAVRRIAISSPFILPQDGSNGLSRKLWHHLTK